MSRSYRAWALLMTLSLGGVGQDALTVREWGQIRDWFQCHECREGELDSVLAVAGHKPGPTIALLRSVLLDGIPPARRDTITIQLRQAYMQTRSVADTLLQDTTFVSSYGPLPPPPTLDDWMVRALAAVDRLYRVRSAFALGRLHTPYARSLLDTALTRPLEPIVLRYVLLARDSLAGP